MKVHSITSRGLGKEARFGPRGKAKRKIPDFKDSETPAKDVNFRSDVLGYLFDSTFTKRFLVNQIICNLTGNYDKSLSATLEKFTNIGNISYIFM